MEILDLLRHVPAVEVLLLLQLVEADLVALRPRLELRVQPAARLKELPTLANSALKPDGPSSDVAVGVVCPWPRSIPQTTKSNIGASEALEQPRHTTPVRRSPRDPPFVKGEARRGVLEVAGATIAIVFVGAAAAGLALAKTPRCALNGGSPAR